MTNPMHVRPLTDFGDIWPHGRLSPHYFTVAGCIEYVLVRYMLTVLESNQRFCDELGFRYGDLNRMGLYLCHWSYSPFVDYVGD